MSNETIVTVVGNLTDAPELRFTASGAAVASFTIASTPRKFNKQTESWEDSDTLFMRCSIWREAAENVAESLIKGIRVIAQGRLVQRSYDTREGEKRTVVELQVDEVGPSLTFATAKVERAQRNSSAPNPSGGVRQSAPANDPWAPETPAASTSRGFNDEPVF